MIQIHGIFGRPRLSGAALLACLLSACGGQTRTSPVPADLTACADPRPEVCAQVYLPVCATRDAGLASDWKTYSNACTACADVAVYAHRAGACETQ